ncbi:MAG: hypothetical protein IE931_05560 [Sphingobacteriales bacterium]|nr:hypothetical protein [Sphingobacteriales bacterium]
MKTTTHNLTAVLQNALIGVFIAGLFGVDSLSALLLAAVIPNALMLVFALVKFYITGAPIMERGMALSGLLKEIWISKLMERFYPDGSFLLEAEDMSSFVENNTINLADAGVDPTVLVNNSSYPIAISERTDVPLALPLDYYDTENTVVRNAEAVQLAYSKMESVVRQHRNALYKENVKKAIWNYAPSANGANTPVIEIGSSIIDAFIDAEQKFDDLDVPKDRRVVVLSGIHKAKLKKEDKVLFKDVFGQGGSGMLYSFKVHNTSVMPVYDGTLKTKKAYGAASAGDDIISSVFFSGYEVMRAEGTYDMFSRLKDPENRGDIVGFQKRFLALPIRGKYIGAIIGN